MKRLQITLAGLAVLTLSACASNDISSRTLTANGSLLSEAATVVDVPSYRISAVNVVVPESLSVSEANTFKPRADIVWRGDPFGNRNEQVATLVENAIKAGVSEMSGTRAVVLNIQVSHFHALTQRARYTVGGTHDIHFYLTILDAKTGVIIEPARLIKTELRALGGEVALLAESRGQTQKVRISEHLRMLILQEMAKPRAVLPV